MLKNVLQQHTAWGGGCVLVVIHEFITRSTQPLHSSYDVAAAAAGFCFLGCGIKDVDVVRYT